MAGLQTNVYVAVSITWAAALTALVLRILARRMTKRPWGFEDYFCLSAFIFASGYNSILMIWTTDWGLGKFIDLSLPEDYRENILFHSRLLMYCSQFCYAFSIASSKFAILSLYWRFFRLTSIRIPIQLMFVISLIWLILRTFMVIFHCVPVQAYWDSSIKDATCAIKDAQFFFGTVLTHFVMDIIIIILPIIELSKLHRPLGEKLAIISLFIVGSIVCLASIFVIVESVRYDTKSEQMSHDVALNFMWGSVEINIAIVSACFPLLKPIFRKALPSWARTFFNSYIKGQSVSQPLHPSNMRLKTIPMTKNKDADESSSTHQIADLERGLPSTPEFEKAAEGSRTVILSQIRNSCGVRNQDIPGRRIQNKLSIEVEETERSDSSPSIRIQLPHKSKGR